MKNLSNFAYFALNNDETFEIKGGTFCSGNNYSVKSSCRPSKTNCSFSKPSYNGCDFSIAFSSQKSNCNTTPKSCNPTPPVLPPAAAVMFTE
jgi:hypothetical protein